MQIVLSLGPARRRHMMDVQQSIDSAMPTVPKRRKGRISTWMLVNVACGLGLLVIIVTLNRYGVAELIARLDGKAGARVVTPTGPKVVRLGRNASDTSSQALPTIVRPGINSDSPPGSNLPTIIRLGPNAPRSSGTTLLPQRISVVDGDTINADGKHYRLIGIDTPESGPRAKCAAERDKAQRATKRLAEIIAGGNLSLDRVSCNCPPNTEGTGACNYGRLCGMLKSNGRDVGLMLVAEGLAKRYDCSAGHCPPKQSWCL